MEANNEKSELFSVQKQQSTTANKTLKLYKHFHKQDVGLVYVQYMMLTQN